MASPAVSIPPHFTPDELAALEAEHEDIAVLRHPEGRFTVVLRPPTRSEWTAFLTQATDEERRAMAQQKLVPKLTVAAAMTNIRTSTTERALEAKEARELCDKRILERYAPFANSDGVTKAIKKLGGSANDAGE